TNLPNRNNCCNSFHRLIWSILTKDIQPDSSSRKIQTATSANPKFYWNDDTACLLMQFHLTHPQYWQISQSLRYHKNSDGKPLTESDPNRRRILDQPSLHDFLILTSVFRAHHRVYPRRHAKAFQNYLR